MASNKLLKQCSQRLGLIKEDRLNKEAEQYLRVLQSKATIKALSEIAKATLCLDIAAELLCVTFNTSISVSLSGLKRDTYNNKRAFVQKLLGVDKPITIGEVCVQTGNTQIKELATKIYEGYKERKPVVDHPLFVVMSVYVACKLRKIKVARAQFLTLSQLKLSQFNDLEEKFMTYVQNRGVAENEAKKLGKNELHVYLEEHANKKAIENESKRSAKRVLLEDIEEDYEIWKMRILTEAREEIRQKSTVPVAAAVKI